MWLCKYFFEELINKFPNTPIIIYSQGPWEKYRCGVKESDEYLENISKICSNYGLPFYPELYIKDSVLRPWIEENRKNILLPIIMIWEIMEY